MRKRKILTAVVFTCSMLALIFTVRESHLHGFPNRTRQRRKCRWATEYSTHS